MSGSPDPSRGDRARYDKARYEELLGEPIMVPDPRITTAQAARVLGISLQQVHRLAARGRLPRHGSPRAARKFLLSDVRRLDEPITLGEAAEIWDCDREQAAELVVAGTFTETGLPLRPVRRVDVELEQGQRWSRPGPLHPGTHAAVDQAADRIAAGWVGIPAAAGILGISASHARDLATAGRLPAEQDAHGRWWYDAERLRLVADVRQWQQEHSRRPPTWPLPTEQSR